MPPKHSPNTKKHLKEMSTLKKQLDKCIKERKRKTQKRDKYNDKNNLIYTSLSIRYANYWDDHSRATEGTKKKAKLAKDIEKLRVKITKIGNKREELDNEVETCDKKCEDLYEKLNQNI